MVPGSDAAWSPVLPILHTFCIRRPFGAPRSRRTLTDLRRSCDSEYGDTLTSLGSRCRATAAGCIRKPLYACSEQRHHREAPRVPQARARLQRPDSPTRRAARRVRALRLLLQRGPSQRGPRFYHRRRPTPRRRGHRGTWSRRDHDAVLEALTHTWRCHRAPAPLPQFRPRTSKILDPRTITRRPSHHHSALIWPLGVLTVAEYRYG